MTYNEFKAGLYMLYHFTYLKSTPFIKFNVYHSDTSATFEDGIILKVDAQRVLQGLKNKNMIRAFELMAQGYLHWEVGLMLGLSDRTIDCYVDRFKKYLKKVQ